MKLILQIKQPGDAQWSNLRTMLSDRAADGTDRALAALLIQGSRWQYHYTSFKDTQFRIITERQYAQEFGRAAAGKL